ncbi:MAG TPA: hypothetical protein VIK13_14060, partial [Candidatus Limnocylindrales bacterium]
MAAPGWSVSSRDPEFPGERLVVCRNPVLAAERARKREALLAETEATLAQDRPLFLEHLHPAAEGVELLALFGGQALGSSCVD